MLPDSLADAQQQLTTQWQAVMTGFAGQAEKDLKSLRSKLAEFRRLYEAGRYKVLFGLFKGIQQSYAELSPAQQQQQLLQQCQLLIESSKLKAEQLQRYEQLKQKHLSKLA